MCTGIGKASLRCYTGVIQVLLKVFHLVYRCFTFFTGVAEGVVTGVVYVLLKV